MINFIFKLIRKKLFRYQFIRYSIVGALGAVIDFGVLIFLTEILSIYYLASATISFILATISNYILNKSWTFRDTSKKISRQYTVYLLISIVGLLINNGVLYVSVESLGIYYLIGKIIAAALVWIWNFFMNKHVTFKLLNRYE